MAYQYTHVSVAIPAKFLLTQTTGNILATVPQIVGPAGTANANAKRFAISEASIHNRSGGDTVCGVAVRLPIGRWSAGQWTDSGAVFTDDTIDAQDAGPADFPLGTTTNDDGFAVFCDVLFNVMSVIVVTAASGGTPVFVLSYTQAGGTWGTITASTAFVHPSLIATGEQLIWFAIPQDWAVSEAAHGTGVPTGKFGIRITQSTAGTSSGGEASLIMLGHCIYPTEAIGDNKVALVTNEGETPLLPQGDALCAVISAVYNQNRADMKYRMRA